MNLTSKRVEKFRKLGIPGRFLDGQVRGLYLVVSNPNAAHYELRYQLDGHTHFMGLGSAKDFGLDQARRRAIEQRQKLADKIDPLKARRAERAEQKAAAAKVLNFKEAVQLYFDQHARKWKNRKHRAQFLSTLKTYGSPIIGTIPVGQIDTPAVLRVLEQKVIAERGYAAGRLWDVRTETANRVRNRIESVLDWAAVRGYRAGDNAARWIGHLDQVLPSRGEIAKVEHHNALHYRDIPAFMAALRQRQGSAARALEFLILTAARTGEVTGATEAEVDGNTTVWTVPAGRIAVMVTSPVKRG